MEDFFDLDKVKAKVYLLADGDRENMSMITDDKLMIIRDGNKQVYELGIVKKLEIGSKKFLFPLFLGAILAPFSFISYFSNIFHPIIHLISTLLGILLFFIGWVGKPTISIGFGKGNEEYFYLPSVSKNLLAFIDYVNAHLKNRRTQRLSHLIFLEKKGDNLNWLFGEIDDQNEYFPRFGFSFQQVLQDPSLKSRVVAIDPQLAGREIKFEFDQELKIMRPLVKGPVNRSSVLTVINWTEGH